MTDLPVRRGRGRPRTAVLSREKIVDAAFTVLAEQGAAQFSLARVAKSLGAQRPALYNHIADKDELISLMRDAVTEDIDWSAFGEVPWDEAFVPMAWSYRAVFAREPELSTLLAVTPMRSSTRSFRNRDRCVRALMEAGWPEHSVTSVIVAVESFVIGSGLDLLAGPDGLSVDAVDQDDPEMSAFRQALERAHQHHMETGRSAADDAFVIGLESLLSGLRSRLATLVASERDGSAPIFPSA